MKKLLTILSAIVLGAAGSSVLAATKSFPDVSPNDWFFGDVMKMVEWGVIEGNDDGTFKPGNNVNRAELSAMWNRYDNRISLKVPDGIYMDIELSSLYQNLAWMSLDMAEQYRVNNLVYSNHLVSGVSLPCSRINDLKDRAQTYLNRSMELTPSVLDQGNIDWMMAEFDNKYEGCLGYITIEGL